MPQTRLRCGCSRNWFIATQNRLKWKILLPPGTRQGSYMSETAQRLGSTGGQGRVEGDVQALSKGGVPFLAPADGCHGWMPDQYLQCSKFFKTVWKSECLGFLIDTAATTKISQTGLPKQQIVSSYSCVGWKFQDQGTGILRVWWEPSSWVLFLLWHHMAEGTKALFGVSFKRALIPFCKSGALMT